MSAPVVVIGAGPAGMMAALAARERGADVVLLERNPKVGRKLYITGKGRCNVTNHCPPQDALAHIPCNGRFLYSSMDSWPPSATESFFEGLGVPLKVERGNRVFPVSDKAADIVDALFHALRKAGVALVEGRAKALEVRDGALAAVVSDVGTYPCSAAILATGGLSYPATGSTGDGYALAESVGHTVTPARGSLVPLECPGCAPLQGLSLRNVTLTGVNEKGKVLYREQGELLFTHFGLSGPLVLSLSAHLRRFDRERYTAHIDLKPALPPEQLDARLLRDLGEHANQDMANYALTLVPRSLVPVILDRAAIDPHLKLHSLPKDRRRALVEVLKDLSFPIDGPRPVEEAIVTTGGVSVKEVDPKTMASKLVPGLYFAGELLDVDGYTGGYNLQIAWCTGRAAGLAAGEYAARSERAMTCRAIAIDGPSGAGKSTLARAAAQALGFLYVDTGAIYRTVGLAALRQGVSPDDPAAVAALLPGLDITMAYAADGLQHMYLNGEDVTEAIRRHAVSSAASQVSAIPAVRAHLLEMQRRLVRAHDVIMDGRDIGTVVLPDAQLKVYLTAAPEARAKRRFDELAARGETPEFEQILADVIARDKRDTERETAPLRQAEDAIVLDTTALSLEESIALLIHTAKEVLEL